ncbi:MAG: hypothetical protein ACM3ZE_14375 [Myxococcales bacterium]
MNAATSQTPQAANGPASGAPPRPAARVVTSATDGVAAVPPANFGEKRAAALAQEAMNKDYLAMTYANAEKKLRRGLQICTEQKCSPGFNARLHRDLGIIYVVGLNRREDGKKEFATALTLDPTVAISAEMNTDETDKAFLEVKYSLFPETKPAATATPASSASEQASVELESKGSESSDSDAWRQLTNWVSLSFQQELSFHSPTKYVCNHSSYRCIDAAGVPQDFTNRTVTAGNEIPSTKLKGGTLRLLLGYERLLLKNISVGLKLGLVISGKAPRVPGDSAVLLVHGEARVSYFFGAAPFEPTNVVRPYGLAALGISEVSSKVGVDIYEANTYQKVAAWKRSGKFFIGVGGGAVFNLWKNHGPFVEARLNMTDKASIVAALQAGYTYGF